MSESLAGHGSYRGLATFGTRKEFYINLPKFNHHEKVFSQHVLSFRVDVSIMLYITLYKILILQDLAFLHPDGFA
jgi:hypothetical protein